MFFQAITKFVSGIIVAVVNYIEVWERQKVIDDGLYRFVRHPMFGFVYDNSNYFGFILFACDFYCISFNNNQKN